MGDDLGFRRLVAGILRPLKRISAWLTPRGRMKQFEGLFQRLEGESQALVEQKIEQFNQLDGQ